METTIKYAQSSNKARKIVRKLNDKRLIWGHIQDLNEGYLIYATESQTTSAMPDFCNNIKDTEQAICVVKISETTLYILIKESREKVSEYVIDTSNHTSSDLKILTTHIFAIQEKIVNFTVYTNIKYKRVNADLTSFGTFITLPTPSQNVEKAEWTNEYNSFKTDFIPLRTANQIQYSPKVKAIGAVMALLISGTIIFHDKIEQLKTQEISIPLIINAKPSINEGQQKVTDYLQKNGANILESLQVVQKQLNLIDSLTNWESIAVSSQVSNGYQSIVIKLQPINSNSVDEIVKFASDYKFGVDVTPTHAFLEYSTLIHPILYDMAKFHLGSFQIYINTSVPNYWDNTTINIEDNDELKDKQWAFNNINVTIPDTVSEDIASFGSMFYGFPVGFIAIKMERSPNISPRWDSKITLKIGGVKHNG
jgi:hypothetical protein